MIEEEGYSVSRAGGCTVIRGAVPLSEAARLMQGYPEDYRADAAVAGAMGATLVFGSVEACNELRTDLGIELIRGQQ